MNQESIRSAVPRFLAPAPRHRPAKVFWLIGLAYAAGAVRADPQAPGGQSGGIPSERDAALTRPAGEEGLQADSGGRAQPVASERLIRRRGAAEKRVVRRKPARRSEAADRPAIDLERGGVAWYQTGIGSLGIVLALLGGVFYCARKWIPIARNVESNAMRVVARASVAPKQSVALVQLGRRFVMVGVSADQMSVLSVISDRDEVADLALATGTQGAQGGHAFERLLQREREDFVDEDELKPATAARDPIREVGTGTGEALTDLLHRLRKLHSG